MPSYLFHSESQRRFAQLLSRFSRYTIAASDKASDVVVRGDLSPFSVASVRHLFGENLNLGVYIKIDNSKQENGQVQESKATNIKEIEVQHGERLYYLPVVATLDEGVIGDLIVEWSGQIISEDLRLILFGKWVGDVAVQIGVELGFNEADVHEVDGPPSKIWKRQASDMVNNRYNLCIATKGIGHAHTNGLDIRFVNSSSPRKIRQAVRDELRKKVATQ